ncbi:hypothetical protein V6N13_135853 [Hibiscus sabdariffa]|uniref:Uncharacterized protein n=1 Tax=Hibiscus sabdariffa TaxID=183260 RepID=A0ABR2QSR3_9ROSI
MAKIAKDILDKAESLWRRTYMSMEERTQEALRQLRQQQKCIGERLENFRKAKVEIQTIDDMHAKGCVQGDGAAKSISKEYIGGPEEGSSNAQKCAPRKVEEQQCK